MAVLEAQGENRLPHAGSGTLWARAQTLRRHLSWETGGAGCLSPVPSNAETLILNSLEIIEFALALLQG